MSILDPVITRHRSRLVILVHAASLTATAWFLWVGPLSLRFGRQTFVGLLAHALGYTLVACFWSAAIAFGLLLITPAEDRGDLLRSTLRTSAAAVWFAPAMILLMHHSPAALTAALVLILSTTRLLYTEWRALNPGLPLSEACTPAFVISCALQLGAVAWIMRYRFTGAALLAFTAALAVAYSHATGAVEPGPPPSLPRSVFGLILTILLAAGLTVGGSWNLLKRGAGWDDSGDSRLLPNEKPTRSLPGAGDGKQKPETPPPFDGSYPGVILLPEVRPIPRLVAPPPMRGSSIYPSLRSVPFTILFDGRYEMYRPPFRSAPHFSYTRHGSPAALAFSTTDHVPLRMEAVHKFDEPIDLSCCATVRVGIWNADSHPEAISLTLIAWAGLQAVDLGSVPVRSRPADGKPLPETLDFAIPSTPFRPVESFQLVFNRRPPRHDKSARIEIDRFVLVPR